MFSIICTVPALLGLAPSAPLQPRPFDLNPAVSPWILFSGAVIAAVAVVYLYSAQRKIAPRRIVNSLMAIRTVLVLLVVALLLGPVRQWAHTSHSSGTLYVLLDQSLSMRQKDPQSSDRESLAWAQAMGYLPLDLRPSALSLNTNQLLALRDDLDHFRSDADHLSSDSDDPSQRQLLASRLSDWQKKLVAVATSLSAETRVAQAASDVPEEMKLAADTVAKNIALIDSGAASRHAPWLWLKVIGAMIAVGVLIYLAIQRNQFTSPVFTRMVPAICMMLGLVVLGLVAWAAMQWPEVSEIAARANELSEVRTLADKSDIPWQAIHDTLSKAISRIAPIAVEADKDFLDRRGSDPRLQEALNKVKQRDRASLALAALTANSACGLTSLAEMMDRQDVKLVPFGDHNSISTPGKTELPIALHGILQDPSGQNTDIASALKFVSEQAGSDSAVLVVSDGRQNVGIDPQGPAQSLASRGTRVFTLMLGSHLLARDAAVDHVDAPDWIYAQDEVVISPVIKIDGLKGQTVTVELRRDNKVVDTRQIKVTTQQDKLRLRLTDHPPGEGLYDYSVVIPPVPDEAVLDNNSQTVRVAVKKDRLNILLIEDDPGWEYQFLRNYLARDHRVKLQVVLLNPAHIENVQGPQGVAASPTSEEGKIDAQLLPISQEQWAGFDIVIMGDIPPEKMPAEMQHNLTAALKDGNVKALLLQAGERNMPMRYAGTPLAEVIPVELSGSKWTPEQLQDQLRHGYVPALAPDGINSILGQFSDDFATNGALWANMPLWYWHGEQTAARPGASVIWSIQDALQGQPPSNKDSTDEYETTRQHALLTTMNVGLGRVLYLGSPQTWRLRYVQTPGDDSHIQDVHRRFWGQVIRWAAGNDLPAGGKFVKFGANKHSYIGGEPIVITARILKENFSPLQSAAFEMIATAKDGFQAGAATMMPAPSEGAGIYRGSLTLPAGSFVLSVHGGEPERLLNSDTTIDTTQKTLTIDVQPNATVEDRDVNADPEMMGAIARAGSGIAVDGAYFDVLANHLPVVDRTETQVVQAGLFSDPNDTRTKIAHWIFFGIFILLLSCEWILRKRGGLV